MARGLAVRVAMQLTGAHGVGPISGHPVALDGEASDDDSTMLGLLVTVNRRSPIAAAQVEDGVLTVGVTVACAERNGEIVEEACVQVGALLSTKSGESHVKWLHEALRLGDEVEVVVAEIDQPDPWSEDMEYPEGVVEFPTGIEVFLNGEAVKRETVDRPRGVALAMVTWSRGAKTNPTPGEYVHLDIGLEYTRLLSLGDKLRVRMLGA